MVVDGFDKTEPLGVALGMTKEDTISYIPFFVNKYLKEPVSVVVKNADDEMVAVQLCSIESRHQHQSDDLYTKLKPTAKALRVFEFLVHMENDIWSLVPPDVNHILKLQITYVRPDYTGRGIAKQMSSMRMDTARKLGCQGISTTSTNAITQHLRLKEGYQPLKTVMYEDWKDNEGNVIFRMKDASDRAILTFKRF
uniref:aralkylamine N-acetyltransferase n=1 Tax=Plectus sambesii TaxID=2011161 RepID=A0A914VHK5_9BILA